MAPNVFHFVSCIFISFLLILPSHANISGRVDASSTPFGFLKDLHGSRKGDNIKGLGALKKYLEHLGYLRYHESKVTHQSNEDTFDDLLETAIKTYQVNYHLNSTGTLDVATLSKMMMPRCGFPDIVNGTNWMQPKSSSLGSLRIVSHYDLPGPRWPAAKMHLTVGFQSGIVENVTSIVMSAFEKWTSVSHFTFSQIDDFSNADLHISFERGDHGDGSNFDGPGGILAHSNYPPAGILHFDADEHWTNNPVPGTFDLGTVALHEIGHLLGLGHSQIQEAIMYAFISDGKTKGLNDDDIEGIHALYP